MTRSFLNPQFGWHWSDTWDGYCGFMDDYGTFVPEWFVFP